MWHVWGRKEVHTGFLLENLSERDHLQYLGVDGRIILKWTGLIWFRTGTGGGVL
jgi:hypothetical protein